MYNSRCHSVHCSMMFRNTNIWSLQPLPLLNPACSSLRHSSIAVEMLSITILAKILLGIDRSVIPRQLLQLFSAPFLGILMMLPLHQSSGILLLLQIFWNKGKSTDAAIPGSSLNRSALRLSRPGDFPFFRYFIVFTISSVVGISVFTSRSFSFSGMSII